MAISFKKVSGKSGKKDVVTPSSLKGMGLFEIAIFLGVTGALILAGTPFFHFYRNDKHTYATADNVALAQNALGTFYQTYGHFPCPAPRTAAVDSPRYAQEDKVNACSPVQTGLAVGDLGDGTARALGRNNIPVRIGALPVRSLGLPDNADSDGWGHRLSYAVTENYATSSAPGNMNFGAITVQDSNGNNATSNPGNVVYIVMAFGSDPRGAYNTNGLLEQPCDLTVLAGKNCSDKGTFVSTILTSNAGVSTFTDSSVFEAARVCIPQISTGFTSGSGYALQLTGLIAGHAYTMPVVFRQTRVAPPAQSRGDSLGLYLTDRTGVIKNVTMLAPNTDLDALPTGATASTILNFTADAPTVRVGLFVVPGGANVNSYTPAMLNSLEFVNPVTNLPANIGDNVPPVLLHTDTGETINSVVSTTTHPPFIYSITSATGEIYHANGNLNPGHVGRFLRPDEICTLCTPAQQTGGQCTNGALTGTLVGVNNNMPCITGATATQYAGIDPVDPTTLDFGFEDWYWFNERSLPSLYNQPATGVVAAYPNGGNASISCYQMSDGTCPVAALWPDGYIPPAADSPHPLPDGFGGYIADVGDYDFSDVAGNLSFQTCAK
jgi:hypothetical protein